MRAATDPKDLFIEIRGVRLGAAELAHLVELLEDAVVVRPNGDTFQVVRQRDALRYVTVDPAALAHQRWPVA